MKYIALLIVVVAAALGAGYAVYPEEFTRYADGAGAFAARAWDSIEANPVPVLIGVGTFLLTVVYYKVKGTSLRESLAVAATRVRVVTAQKPADEQENPVVRRAKARATRAQLIADRIGLENRHRKLPEEIVKAEKEACYTQQAVDQAEEKLTEAEETMEAKLKAQDDAAKKLDSLRKAKAEVDAELAAIDTELKKLAEVV